MYSKKKKDFVTKHRFGWFLNLNKYVKQILTTHKICLQYFHLYLSERKHKGNTAGSRKAEQKKIGHVQLFEL